MQCSRPFSSGRATRWPNRAAAPATAASSASGGLADDPQMCLGPELSVVFPARDESASICEVLESADRALNELGTSFELIVVDDGSRDGTGDEVRRALVRCGQLKLVRHPQSLGYGAALRSGFLVATGWFIAFTDADGQFDLHDLAKLRAAIKHADVACGYRLERQDAAHRIFFSRCYNTLTRCLLGISVRDCNCALKIFRREHLDLLLPRTKGYLANAETLVRAKRAGLRIVEVGVRHFARKHGESKVTLLDAPGTLLRLLPLALQVRNGPLRVELAAYRPPSYLTVSTGQPAMAERHDQARKAA